MIFYPTKDTMTRYKLQFPDKLPPQEKENALALLEKEQGNRLLEWSGKIFHYQGKKCLQVLHFASKFTLFFMDLKQSEMIFLQKMIEETTVNLFLDDPEMRKSLLLMFGSSPDFCVQKLTDRSAVSSMNRTYLDFCGDGCYLEVYHENDTFRVDKMNEKVNFNYLTGIKVEGKQDYVYTGEHFRNLVIQAYPS